MSYPRSGKTFDVPVIDDAAGLVWAVNLTTVELHPFLGTTGDVGAPTVSVPVTWAEVEQAVQDARSLVFTIDDVPRRLSEHGDLFAPVLTGGQVLPEQT